MRVSIWLLALLIAPMAPLAEAASAGPAAPPPAAASSGPQELLAAGDRLLTNPGGPVDAAAAIAAYEAAIAKGSTIALLRLGDLYRKGDAVRPDFEKAFSYYGRAAAAGNSAGRLRVAEMTARGQGTKQDVEAGRAMARALADTGDASALFALGDMYAGGDAGPIDAQAALAAYRAAADGGNINAMARLGAIYRDGTLVTRDRVLALDYFKRAADGGSTAARFALAKGYVLGQLGDAASSTEGVEMLQQLDAAGVRDAVLVLSDSYLRGQNGGRKDPKAALGVLDDAMARGNVDAGRRLVALYRDGRSRAVRRDLARAQQYLAEIRDNLDPDILATEQLLLGAAAANSVGDYASIRTTLSALDTDARPGVVTKIRVTNPHVYVYLVQSHLKDQGAFGGTPNGRLNADTVRAISRYCTKIGTRDACIRGPISGPVVELFRPLL